LSNEIAATEKEIELFQKQKELEALKAEKSGALAQ